MIFLLQHIVDISEFDVCKSETEERDFLHNAITVLATKKH